MITTLQAIGDHARPVRPLAQGVVFWRTRGMVGSRIGRDHSFTWEFGVPHRDSTIDTFKGSIHDFNGDGFDDVVVAIARHARVYWGGVGGLTEERYTDYRLTDYDQSPRLTVGDVNADGFADVIAMQSYINPSTSVNYMRIEVLHGSGSGLVSDSPDHIADGLQVNTGDINGDGFADGVTNRQRDLGSREVPEATVLFGGQAGLGSGGMMRVSDPRQSREPSGAFGVSSAVGDADGDGYADAILGAVNEDRFAGAVYAYRGGASGLNPSPALRIPTMIDAPRESRWGARIYCIGDINRDGLADFHVAARGETIPVFVGSRTRLLTHAYNAEIPGSSDSISIWSAAAADLDGDGDQDGYWGCTTCYGVNEDGGEIGQLGHVVLLSEGDGGPAVTTIRPPPYPANEPDRTYYFGQGVVAVDVDGDGWDDLVTINPETYDPGWWRGRGRVSVFFGGPGIWGRAVHFYVMPERSGPGAWNLA
ncbi:MAG: FG-GAP and VCBS repeat-containing protein [Polyangiales bacterium]